MALCPETRTGQRDIFFASTLDLEGLLVDRPLQLCRLASAARGVEEARMAPTWKEAVILDRTVDRFALSAISLPITYLFRVL